MNNLAVVINGVCTDLWKPARWFLDAQGSREIRQLNLT